MPTNLQVLEMYHVAGAWRALLTAPGCDITAQLSRDQYRQLREAMVRRTCTWHVRMPLCVCACA